MTTTKEVTNERRAKELADQYDGSYKYGGKCEYTGDDFWIVTFTQNRVDSKKVKNFKNNWQPGMRAF